MWPHRLHRGVDDPRRCVVGGQVDGDRGDPVGITDRLLQLGEPGLVASGAHHGHARLGEL